MNAPTYKLIGEDLAIDPCPGAARYSVQLIRLNGSMQIVSTFKLTVSDSHAPFLVTNIREEFTKVNPSVATMSGTNFEICVTAHSTNDNTSADYDGQLIPITLPLSATGGPLEVKGNTSLITPPPAPVKDEVTPILNRVKTVHDEYDKNLHIQMGPQGKAYGDIRDEQGKQLQGLRTSPNLAMATDLLGRAEKFIEDAKAEIATRPILKEVKDKLDAINTKIGTLPVSVTDPFKTRAAELTAQYSAISADPNPTKATELLTKVKQLYVDVEMAVRTNATPPTPPAPAPVPSSGHAPQPAPAPAPRPRNTNLPIAQERVKLARSEALVSLVPLGLDGKYLPELQGLEAVVGKMDETTPEGEVGQVIDKINKFIHNAKAEVTKAAKPAAPAPPTPAAPATPTPGATRTPAAATAATAGTPPTSGTPAGSAPASGSSSATAPSGPKKFLGLTHRVWLWILGALLIPLIGLLVKPYVQDMFASKGGSAPQVLSSSDYAELQRRRASDHGMTVTGQPGISMTMTTSQGSNSLESTVIMTNSANSNNAPQVIGNNNQVLFMSQPTITNIIVNPTASAGGGSVAPVTQVSSSSSEELKPHETRHIIIPPGGMREFPVPPGWTIQVRNGMHVDVYFGSPQKMEKLNENGDYESKNSITHFRFVANSNLAATLDLTLVPEK
jgi:hypothetical protein